MSRRHTLSAMMLRRGDKRRIPDRVLERNNFRECDWTNDASTHVAAISRTSTTSSSRHLQTTYHDYTVRRTTHTSLCSRPLRTSMSSTNFTSWIKNDWRK